MFFDEVLANMAMIAAGRALQVRTPTAIPRMTIWFGHRPTDPTPAMYEPKFYLVLQGRKRMTIGDKTLDLAAGGYAVSAVGLPFTGQVIEASPQTPYVGIEFALEPSLIANLLFDMPNLDDGDAPAIDIAQATEDVTEPLDRLLRLLDEPVDVPMLAPQL